MPRIIYITFSYSPETAAPAARASDATEFLRDNGWQVTVLTHAPNYPRGRVFEGYGGRRDVRQEDGIEVVRFRPWIVNKSNFTLRLLSELYFSLRCAWFVLRQPADIVLATSPYMLLGPVAVFACWLRRIPLVWEVRDLTWLYAAAAGKRTFGAHKLLEALMLWTGRHVSAMITTTVGQLRYFESRQSAPACVEVVPNGVSEGFVRRFDSNAESLGPYPENRKVVYAGLLGYAQGLSTLIDAAALVPSATFVLVGEGAQRASLEQAVRDRQLSNVHFTGYVSLDEVISHYVGASVLVAHLKRDPVFEITQPSKIWEYMVSRRPVVYGGAGEAAIAVDGSGGGLVVPADDPVAMAGAIVRLLDDRVVAERMGQIGRDFVLEYKSRTPMLERLEQTLKKVLRKRYPRRLLG